jgi:hypothetical protein
MRFLELRSSRSYAHIGLATVLALAGVTACSLGAPPAPEGPSPTGASSTPDAGAAPAAECIQPTCSELPLPASAHVVRLTHSEWEGTTRDLLRLPAAPGLSSSFPTDPAPPSDQFGTDSASLIVVNDLWREYRRAAETLADLVVSDPAAVERLLPPAAKTGSVNDRVRAFVADLLPRAYRRPATEWETLATIRVGEQGVASDTTSDPFLLRMKWILVTTLQSPFFVYRTQVGEGEADAAGRVRLGRFELAEKLSYSIWGTIPDQALTEAAAAGKLATNEGVAKAARSMLADPRARERLAHFHDELFEVGNFRGVERQTSLFPKYYPEFAADAQEDVRRTLEALVLEDTHGGVEDVLASPTAFVNARLAAVYGIDPASVPGLVEQPQKFVRVTMDERQRAGILSHVGWLAMHGNATNPATIMRGVFLARHILCIPLGSPPPGAAGADPATHAHPTDRERVEATTKGCGVGCHSGPHGVINPLGFALGGFDALGQFRKTENGFPVDTTGTTEQLGAFDNAASMLKLASKSPHAHACYAAHLSAYLNGTSQIQTTSMSTWLAPIVAESMQGASIRDLIVRLVQTDAFLTISR